MPSLSWKVSIFPICVAVSFYVYLDVLKPNTAGLYAVLQRLDAFPGTPGRESHGSGYPTTDTTAVVLNWSRFPNVQLISSLLCGPWLDGIIKEVVIWNNNPNKIYHSDFTHTGCSRSKLRIHNSPENVYFQARFIACAHASTPYCFIQDDDYLVRAEIIHMLHTRLNQTSHPHTIHLLPPHEHLSTTLREIHVLPPSTHPVHTSFAWLGHGTMLHRSEAVAFLALLTRLNASEDEMRMADNYYTVLGNRVPEVWLDQEVELGGGQPFTVGGEGESRNARHILRATEYLKDVLRVQSSEMPFYTSVETGDVLPEHVTRAACRGISCLLETNIRLLPDGMVHASDDVSDILKQEETNLKTLGPDSISRYIGHPLSHAVDGDPSTFFESPFGATQGDYITLHVAEDLTMTQPDDDTFALALNMTWTVDADTERILPHVSVRTSHNGDDWCPVATKMRCADTETEGPARADPHSLPQMHMRQCSVQVQTWTRSSPASSVGGDSARGTAITGCDDGSQFALARYVRAEVQGEVGADLPRWRVYDVSVRMAV